MKRITLLTFALLLACSGAPPANSSQPGETGIEQAEATEMSAQKSEKARPPRGATQEELTAFREAVAKNGWMSCDGTAFRVAWEKYLESAEDDDVYPEESECHPPPDQYCDQTTACAEQGLCSKSGADERTCVMNDGDCAKSSACKMDGRCDEVYRYGCAPRTDDDCAESTACAQNGLCVLGEDHKCVKLEDAMQCDEGKVRIDHACYLPADYDCATECEEEGECDPLTMNMDESGFDTSKPYVACVESDADCRKQPRCKEDGQCSAVGYELVSMNKCDGMRFQSCDYLVTGGCRPNAKDCAKTSGCRQNGDCGVSPYSSVCQPAKPEHCTQSAGCKEGGNCFMVPVSGGNTCGTKEEAESD